MAISGGSTIIAEKKQDWGCCNLALMGHRMLKKGNKKNNFGNLHFMY